MSIASKLLQRAASTCTSITSSISSSVVPVFRDGGRMTAATTVSSSINHQHKIMRSPMHQLESPNNIPSNRSSVLVTPPPKQLLLLEGDEMYISPNGKSYTIYTLDNQNVSRRSSHSHCSVNNDRRREQIRIEEVYDIELSKKSIGLHIDDSASSSRGVLSSHRSNSTRTNERHQSIIREERDKRSCCFTFDIQEINNGVLNGSGTGSMSWDSSIGKYLLHLFILCSSDTLCVHVYLFFFSSSFLTSILNVSESNGIILYTTSK